MNLQRIEHLNLTPSEAEEIKDMFAQTTDCSLFDNSKECDAERLRKLNREWQENGAVTVFKAGVFDLLHNNHLLFLNHLRLIGAREYLMRVGIKTPSQAQLLDISCSDKVRVILTVDSDERVRSSKGLIPNKGYSPRPTLSWENRAIMLSHQQIMVLDKGKTLVDAITRHGKNACKLESCPHGDDSALAKYLQPDVLVINKNSSKSVELSAEFNSHVVILDETQLAFNDKWLGGAIKTSTIINRVKKYKNEDSLS